MKIQEVSKVTGLPISTLHYYEKIAMVTPKRTANNYRDYSEKDIEVLTLIMIMKEYEFNHREIREVIARYTKPIFDLETFTATKEFFETKIEHIEKRIHEYRLLIKIIKTFPVMQENTTIFETKIDKRETLQLIKNLHQEILSETKST